VGADFPAREETLMLPGKQYKPEDYIAMVWRRKFVLIVPFVLITLGTAIWSQLLPNRYRSEARILIVPQQVPEDFVQPTVTTRLDARLQAIAQQIQSRTRLERIIQELNLYEDERQTRIMEDVVEMMRQNISIEIPRDRRGEPGYFTVAFTTDQARTAMQVTERIASQFITESLQDRTVQADQTSQFLETQLEDARRRLLDHEQKLEEFRRKFVGQLPSQVQSNLTVMQSTQVQIQNLVDTMNRDSDRQLVLDKMMADLMAVGTAKQQLEVVPDGTPAAAPIAQQLEVARTAMRALELRLKPEHPDVIRARRVIRELEEKAAAEELNTPVGTGTAPARPVLLPADLARLSQMQAERESLDRRIAASRAEQARLQKVLMDYRTRVEAAPQRESEEVELTRDYGTIKEQYETLLARSQESRIAADLERRQIGEQFKLIDAARLPERPISPDRLRLNLMGALAGLALGLALIALIEYRNTTFRTDEDITLSLALPVFAVIPAMTTRRERQTRRRRWLVAVTASVAVMAAGVAALVWKMDAIVAWVR
jgi:polysaccharide chain length determinant protein (PEP-CTERM system associated)